MLMHFIYFSFIYYLDDLFTLTQSSLMIEQISSSDCCYVFCGDCNFVITISLLKRKKLSVIFYSVIIVESMKKYRPVHFISWAAPRTQ